MNQTGFSLPRGNASVENGKRPVMESMLVVLGAR
jgi:hypothetical protein